MTLFARSDLAYVHLSPAHEGCGQPHRRLVEHGAPAKVWALTCVQCEKHLSKDPLWAATMSDLPETYDEVKGREDFEKRGANDRDNVMAIALASLANVQLPESLRRSISGVSPAAASIAGMVICQHGHDCQPGSKFCPQCGSAMRPAILAACPNGHHVGPDDRFCPECGSGISPASLDTPAIEPPATRAPAAAKATTARTKPLKDWRLTDLQARARELGLDDSGTRLEVLERVKQARVPQAA